MEMSPNQLVNVCLLFFFTKICLKEAELTQLTSEGNGNQENFVSFMFLFRMKCFTVNTLKVSDPTSTL